MKYDALRERALANFELLLDLWKIDFTKITEHEYDLLATWRHDRNFGSCRFNTNKGRGADFAGSSLEECDFQLLGSGFTKSDYTGFSENFQTKIGFDIIGLSQRIYRLNSYKDAGEHLNSDLRTIIGSEKYINPASDATERRKKELEDKANKIKKYANDLWESSIYHPLEGSVGQTYLETRRVYIQEKNIRFHPCIQYSPTKQNFPAVLFKVQTSYDGPLVAIHRIFLNSDGKRKADVDNPKMALASIKGAGIWFGAPDPVLHIAEGPENALTLRVQGAKFVWCGIFSSNVANLKPPGLVKKLIVAADPDPAGQNSYTKLLKNLDASLKLGLEISNLNIKSIKKSNGKFADLNDIWLSAL